jgi:hypothetical protein
MKILFIAIFCLSIILGILYPKKVNIDPTLAEFRANYRQYLTELEERDKNKEKISLINRLASNVRHSGIKVKILTYFASVFGDSHIQATSSLIDGESHFNPYATNSSSGACGIFQAYPCEKLIKVCGTLDNIECQIEWGKNYIIGRYKNPTNAYNFWLSQRPYWY